MKGKLFLSNIINPVEDMQVVSEGQIYKIDRISTKLEPEEVRLKAITVDVDLIACKSELKQIAVEYKPYPHSGISKKGTGPGVFNKHKETLPLHPSDWEWALLHIGENVEFERFNISQGDGLSGKPLVQIAKLIHKEPVLYTEEEVLNILLEFRKDKCKEICYRLAVIDWWNQNKKKQQ